MFLRHIFCSYMCFLTCYTNASAGYTFYPLLFGKGKTPIISKIIKKRIDLVIPSHSRERKTPSYSKINMVGVFGLNGISGHLTTESLAWWIGCSPCTQEVEGSTPTGGHVRTIFPIQETRISAPSEL